MRQPLSSLTRLVVAAVLAGGATGAVADIRGFLDVNGTFSTINVPGARLTWAYGINDSGQIVGRFDDNIGGHGFLYAGGTFSTINVPGSVFTVATGINNAGQIVGWFYDRDVNPHGFLY